MSFPSKYNFLCAKCGKRGLRGERISWSRKVGEKGIVYHASCAPNFKEPVASSVAIENDIIATVQTNNEETKPMTNQNALDVFAEAIAPKVQEKLKSSIDENAVKELIKKELDKIAKPKVLEIRNLDNGDISKIEVPHKSLAKLLYYVGKRHHVYLHGPAGSGKSTSAQQVAEALKLSFGYLSLNPQTPDSRILGFLDAGGTYRPTPFFDCYKNGGVFCIDEMDNASASLLTTLNSMLENGKGAFPCGIIERHKDFVLVATGNTNGKGANPMFPERRPFDTAFSERFTFLQWDYDLDLETKVTLQINPKAETWLTWIRNAREYVTKNFPRILISPRASFKGAEYLKDGTLTPAEIAEGLIFKGIDQDTVRKILRDCPLTSVEVGGK